MDEKDLFPGMASSTSRSPTPPTRHAAAGASRPRPRQQDPPQPVRPRPSLSFSASGRSRGATCSWSAYADAVVADLPTSNPSQFFSAATVPLHPKAAALGTGLGSIIAGLGLGCTW